MRLVRVESLVAGNILASPIFASSGKIILNTGVSLNVNYISRLKSLGVHKVYIEDERFKDVEYYEPLDIKTKNDASQVIRDTYEKLHKGKKIDEYLIKGVAGDIIDYVRNSKDKSTSTFSTTVIDEYIVKHSIDVAILAAFMGNRMSYNASQLNELVTGALIHDFGRENISEEHQEHVKKGFDFMRNCTGISLHSSIVCFEHHENFDGSGYPRKLKGTAISEFTRVVRIADLYSNILNGNEISKEPVMPHQAYEHILALSGSIVDPGIVGTFRDTITFYPNGCTVLLSNEIKGIVVRQNIGSPQRPVVRTFNNKDVTEEVDLTRNLTLFVKEVILV